MTASTRTRNRPPMTSSLRLCLLTLAVLSIALLAAPGLAQAMPRVLSSGTVGAPAPGNDNRANARQLAAPPVTVSGTTVGATEEPRDPRSECGKARATVWYRLSGTASGRVMLRFSAFGDLDAIVSVYRVVRSRLTPVACNATDEGGHGILSFNTASGDSYLIMVGREASSDDGTFKFTLIRPEPSSRPPGTPLPRRGISSSVDPLSDFDDAWSLPMRPGITYRMNLAPGRGRCVTLSLYRPRTRSFRQAQPLVVLHCGGYRTYTPGADGGGRYTLLVTATDTRPGRERYHLQTAVAGPDDMAPGLPLQNLQSRSGSLAGTKVDVVDLYRFRVLDRSDVTLRLGGSGSFSLTLLSETGQRLSSASGGSALTIRLSPGRYFAAARAEGYAHGRYHLSLLERRITTTTVLIDGARVATVSPGSSVSIGVSVDFSPQGTVRLEIDRFDPLTGWQFHQLYRLRLGGNGRTAISWRPPTIGRWRARALFRGTRTASPSVGRGSTVVVAGTL
jgi:hypothetical protein